MHGLLYREGNAALNLHIFHAKYAETITNASQSNDCLIRCTNVEYHGQLFHREWRCRNEGIDDKAATTAPAHWRRYQRHKPTEAMLVVFFLPPLRPPSILPSILRFLFSPFCRSTRRTFALVNWCQNLLFTYNIINLILISVG